MKREKSHFRLVAELGSAFIFEGVRIDVVRSERQNGAPQDVTELLEKLPGNKYEGPDDVMRAYGEAR